MNLLVVLAILAGMGLGFVIGTEVQRRVSEPRHLAELKRMAMLLQYGTLTNEPAKKIPGPPDAMVRAQKQIHDDRVANGVAALQLRYKEKGLTLTDDEARVQVEAMIAGRPLEEVLSA